MDLKDTVASHYDMEGILPWLAQSLGIPLFQTDLEHPHMDL